MPSYDWKCELCEKAVLIENKMSDSHVPPEEKAAEGCEHKWLKLMSPPARHSYAYGWGTDRKGKWGK